MHTFYQIMIANTQITQSGLSAITINLVHVVVKVNIWNVNYRYVLATIGNESGIKIACLLLIQKDEYSFADADITGGISAITATVVWSTY